MLISLKLYICTHYLSRLFAVLNILIFCKSLFSITNPHYGQGKEMCSAQCTRILQGSEKGSTRIGSRPRESLISAASAKDENG